MVFGDLLNYPVGDPLPQLATGKENENDIANFLQNPGNRFQTSLESYGVTPADFSP